MKPKPETAKPKLTSQDVKYYLDGVGSPSHPVDCVAKGHEITRMFGEPKKGRVEADCICWTCMEKSPATNPANFLKSWVEVWVVEKAIEE